MVFVKKWVETLEKVHCTHVIEVLGNQAKKVELLFSRVALFVLSHFSCVWLFVTLWTVACQTLLSIWFSRQEYWNGLPCPPPGIFLIQGSNLHCRGSSIAGRFFTIEPCTREAQLHVLYWLYHLISIRSYETASVSFIYKRWGLPRWR